MRPERQLELRNAQTFAREEIPALNVVRFRERVATRVALGWRLVTFFGLPAEGTAVELVAVLADDAEARLELLRTEVEIRFPSLTPDCVQASRFEREICEQMGLLPEGHPWLKPLRSHARWGPGPFDLHAEGTPIGADHPFFSMQGEEVHEVAVGPVHAGIIEPGHFRFQCHGETVYNLEIMLGYQHRGLERLLEGGPDARSPFLVEAAAGDTTVGHAIAYAQAVEQLAGCAVPPRGQALRALALELERLANHTGDLGALAGDVAFLPTASFCGRLRGSLLNLTADLCGSRLGRGLVRPGGTAFDLDADEAARMRQGLEEAERGLRGAVALFFASGSVQARLEDTGIVAGDVATELGLVGPAARACGLRRDVRHDHPTGHYRLAQIATVTAPDGDVHARATVRWLEIQRSLDFARTLLAELPAGPTRAPCGRPGPGLGVVSLVEGWRGEIAHVLLTDGAGAFERFKITDPSFHNWPALEMALRGQAISDFPLINKSFNLSYAGHDL